MNFNSLTYYIFLPVMLFLYFFLTPKLRNPVLLAASYFFYMCWKPEYVILMLLSTATTYACALLMSREPLPPRANENQQKQIPAYTSPIRRRVWLILSLLINLLILFFFKYYNFSVDLVTRILAIAQIYIAPPISGLLLPVGISFYTFQALGYTMDVYRCTVEADLINSTRGFI